MNTRLALTLAVAALTVATSASANPSENFDPVITLDELSKRQIETLHRVYGHFADSPEEALIMGKLGFCESSLEHIDSKTEEVKTNHNNNGSVDRGLFQINSVHDKTLNELGLDVTDETDNIEYAEQLLAWKKGKPTDWSSSKECWSVVQIPTPEEVRQAMKNMNSLASLSR